MPYGALLRYADAGNESRKVFQAPNFPAEHVDGSLSIRLFGGGKGVRAQGEADKAKAGAP